MTTKSENLIHVKFDYNEALRGKRDMLSAELGLLKIAKTIKNYRALRIEELKLKTKVHRKLSELNTKIKKLEAGLPKLKIPEILKDGKEDLREIKEEIKEEVYDEELENQLHNIKDKLRHLGE